MKVCVIGSGGREHAICSSLKNSTKVSKIYCVPGNAGTNLIAENVQIELSNFEQIKDFIQKNKIDLVIIGPEKPLVDGIVDYLESYNIKVFGPNKIASQLEGSKIFTKKICEKYKIPTAKFGIFNSVDEASNFLNNCDFPIVVKADGLAAGKGVTICKSKKKIISISNEIFKGKFKSSKKLVLEEFLGGEELSYFLIVDKFNYKFFGSAQDHKRVGEKDTGPNTGGMGAYSPAPIINRELEKQIIEKIVNPTLLALKKKKNPYQGFLYVGLMIKNNKPYLIEYNIRMGDPECQVIIPRLKTDLLKILNAAVSNNLNKINIKWKNLKCMTIVMCSKGYPGNYQKNKTINLKNIKLKKNLFIYHAGTKILNNNLVSSGGRVLNISSVGSSFKNLRNNIIKTIKSINWKFGFFRRDIGWRVIKNK